MQQQEQPLRVACPGMTAIAVVAVTDTDVNTCAATQALLLPARVCWDPTLACWVECISSESAPDHLPRGLSSSSRPSYQALLLNCLLVSCMRGTSQPGELACVFGGGVGWWLPVLAHASCISRPLSFFLHQSILVTALVCGCFLFMDYNLCLHSCMSARLAAPVQCCWHCLSMVQAAPLLMRPLKPFSCATCAQRCRVRPCACCLICFLFVYFVSGRVLCMMSLQRPSASGRCQSPPWMCVIKLCCLSPHSCVGS